MFRLTHCILVLSVDVSLGATGGEEEDVVAFVGGDSAGQDEGMLIGGTISNNLRFFLGLHFYFM